MNTIWAANGDLIQFSSCFICLLILHGSHDNHGSPPISPRSCPRIHSSWLKWKAVRSTDTDSAFWVSFSLDLSTETMSRRVNHGNVISSIIPVRPARQKCFIYFGNNGQWNEICLVINISTFSCERKQANKSFLFLFQTLSECVNCSVRSPPCGWYGMPTDDSTATGRSFFLFSWEFNSSWVSSAFDFELH